MEPCISCRYLRWRGVLSIAVCLTAFTYAFHVMMPLMGDAISTQPAFAATRNHLTNVGTSGLISTVFFQRVRSLAFLRPTIMPSSRDRLTVLLVPVFFLFQSYKMRILCHIVGLLSLPRKAVILPSLSDLACAIHTLVYLSA